MVPHEQENDISGRPLPLNYFTGTSILGWSSSNHISCLDPIHITHHVETNGQAAHCSSSHNCMCYNTHFNRGDALKSYSEKSAQQIHAFFLGSII